MQVSIFVSYNSCEKFVIDICVLFSKIFGQEERCIRYYLWKMCAKVPKNSKTNIASEIYHASTYKKKNKIGIHT